jgi:hypothetical protein
VTRGTYSARVNPCVTSASLHHIEIFYFGVLHNKQKLHHHEISNSEMTKGTIVSLENLKGKTLKSRQPSISVGYVNRPITLEIL